MERGGASGDRALKARGLNPLRRQKGPRPGPAGSRCFLAGAAHEQAVKTAFHTILQAAAGSEWTLVPEFTPKGKRIRYDGALRDAFHYTLGYWEAKDSADDLDREVQRKVARGYSLRNTLFQAPDRALLYQDGRLVLDADLTEPRRLAEALGLFLRYQEPQIERFHEAVAEFRAAIPDLAAGLLKKIDEARRSDADFRRAFESFVETVREAVNPNVATEAVEEMLVQHLLTERVVRTVFDNPDFARRNAIAAEIEKVIDALTARHMSRTAFLGRLDRFYRAIEEAADGITDWAEKQDFLNTVYEQFFQGFSDRVADTHGIVYTPQPLVDFMVRSVDALLHAHFGQQLADPGVHVLDPFVGTGNFLVRVIEQIPAPALPEKYRHELHANEVMLLPYYVASLNVEHAFREKTGRHEPFDGIVLVDTFEMVEGKTAGMFSAENTERAQRQRNAPIKVILGNPPYNAHQVNANDANQNRKYPHVDGRVSETYAAASTAQNKNALSDPYVKAFRWASDRIGDAGLVAFVTNDSFLDSLAFDGMRRHLAGEFDEVWVVGLGGNVRKNPKLSGTTHNVFGIQVGVAITFLVRTEGRRPAEDGRATIYYAEAGADWKKEQKYDWLAEAAERIAAGPAAGPPAFSSIAALRDEKAVPLDEGDSSVKSGAKRPRTERGVGGESLGGLEWRELEPNKRNVWLTGDLNDEWEDFLPLASADEKASDEENETTILDEYCPGLQTNRDVWIYGFDRERLAERVERFADTYNAQVVKWQRKGNDRARMADVVTHDDTKIKWSSSLKRHLQAGTFADYDEAHIRRAMYRPFVGKWLYFEPTLIHRRGHWHKYFPTPDAENRVLWLKVGAAWPMFALMVDRPADVLPQGGSQCFPFYVYAEDGSRRENLTDWALGLFREHYADEAPRHPLSPVILNSVQDLPEDGAGPSEIPKQVRDDTGSGGDTPSGEVRPSRDEITKWDVFYYAYAVLHHGAYRARYAADLKRSLPRLPLAPAFWPFAEAGRALADLHVGYESAPEYPLDLVHDPDRPLSYRVSTMKLDEAAGTLRLNDALTLTGLPEAAHRYRLGNRSALAWLADQLRVKTDRRSGITHDPNAAFPDDEIVRLLRRVTHVSVETVRIVEALPDLGLPAPA